MALATGIAYGDISGRPEYRLGERSYYERYAAPGVASIKQEAAGIGGAAQRGAQKTQGQLASAQLGGGLSFMKESASGAMAPAFRRIMARVVRESEKRAADHVAGVMGERQAKRALGAQQLSSVTSTEAAMAAAIPDYGISSGVTGLSGAAMQAGLSKRGGGPGYLPSIDFSDIGYGDDYGPAVSSGGGGLYDLQNITSTWG